MPHNLILVTLLSGDMKGRNGNKATSMEIW